MKCVLVTGATGNVGRAVIDSLVRSTLVVDGDDGQFPPTLQVIAAVRDVDRAQKSCPDEWRAANVQFRTFDFEDPRTFDTALGDDVTNLFLLRPPHLTSIDRVFRPFLERAKAKGIVQVVFLSVQGVEKSSMIPHYKIEQEIKDRLCLPSFVFLRPSYFMQNLTTTLYGDIVVHRRIILPAGSTLFNWVDVKNIGEVAAHVIVRPDDFRNTAIEITGYENENFETVTSMIQDVTGADDIMYQNMNPIRFFIRKWWEGMPTTMILVMILLHWFPRFQKDDTPDISREYERIIGRPPTTLKEFLEREKDKFLKQQT